LYECLKYYDFEKEAWTKIRTERSFREVRRRDEADEYRLASARHGTVIYRDAKNLNANWKKSFSEFTTRLLTLPISAQKPPQRAATGLFSAWLK